MGLGLWRADSNLISLPKAWVGVGDAEVPVRVYRLKWGWDTKGERS